MNKKVLVGGLLAGGIAITGLTGSAYAESSGRAKPTTPPTKKQGGAVVVCTTDGGKAKPGAKKTLVIKSDVAGKAGQLPKVPGKPMIVTHDGKVTAVGGATGKPVKVIRSKDGHAAIVAGKTAPGVPLKGAAGKLLKCSTVKPGTRGVPPAPPAH